MMSEQNHGLGRNRGLVTSYVTTSAPYCNDDDDDSPPLSGVASSTYAVLCDRGVTTSTATTPTPITTHESLRAHSHSSILFSEFNLIREVDADILEQGVEEKWGLDVADFDDEGRRMKASESSLSLAELLDYTEGATIEGTTTTLDQEGECAGIDKISEDVASPISPASFQQLLLLDNSTMAPTRELFTGDPSSNDVLSMPAINEEKVCHIPHPASSALAAIQSKHPPNHHNMDIPHLVEVEPLENNVHEYNDYFLGSDSATTTPRSVHFHDKEAIAKRLASGRSHQRSDSFDRRMSESAQFAESVGEAPDTIFLKKIIEEDSSSDFDDDEIDEEIADIMQFHVEKVQENEQAGDQDDDVEGMDSQRRDDDDATEQLREYSFNEIEPTTNLATELTNLAITEGERSSYRVSPQEEYSTPSPSPFKSNWRPSLTTAVQPPCYVDWHFTRQFSSSVVNLEGFRAANSSKGITISSGEAEFAYRGIRANPPEITKRGLARGNYATMHRKAWLEVTDKHHRYGKNLRMYYKHWEELGHPFHMFFDWLDSRGEAEGHPLPNLPELPRPVLDSDTVLYITDPEISETYALDFVVDHTDGSAIILGQNGSPVDTGTEGWIFVLRDQVFYGSQKVIAPSKPATSVAGAPRGVSPEVATPRQRFHHSSFFGGKAVASAGIFLTDEGGRLTKLYPHSGHYRPGEAHMQRVLFFLQQMGVDLSTFVVDMQQIFKVSRESAAKGGNTAGGGENGKDKNDQDKENKGTSKNCKLWQVNSAYVGGAGALPHTKKPKKLDCLQLLSAQEVAFFLAHKALMIEKGVFHQIHKIRRVPKESRESIRFILNYVKN